MADKFREWEDKDLGTPLHDKLVIKLLNPDVWRSLIELFKLLEFCYGKSDLDHFKRLNINYEIKTIQAEVLVGTIGYADIVLEIKCGSSSPRNIACEIKATEPSFGSVLRQINKYKSYTYSEWEHWVVISPYKEWQEPLKSQGITWIPSELVLVL